MTKISQARSIEDLSNDIITLASIYQTSKDAENFKLLVKGVTLLVPIVRHRIMKLSHVPYDEFDQDIILEFMSIVISNRPIGDPIFKVRSLMNYHMDRSRRITERKPLDLVDEYVHIEHNFSMNDRFKFEDLIKNVTDGLSDDLKIQILFYIKYPELLPKLIKSNQHEIDKYIVACKTYEVLRNLMKSTSTVDIKFNPDRVANLLMMSGIYNISPASFVLLSLLGDFKKFIQFLTLFEGQTITIPKIKELEEVISKSNDLSNKFTDDKLSIRDRENLSTLVTNLKLEDINSDTEINPLMNEYISKIVEISSESYQKMQENILKNLDYSDPVKLQKTYEVLNREHRSSIKLLSEIITSLTTVDDIRTIISQIRK